MYYMVVHVMHFSFSVFFIYALIFGCVYYEGTRNFADLVNLIAKLPCLPASESSKFGN
jgi:hypothetical protein